MKTTKSEEWLISINGADEHLRVRADQELADDQRQYVTLAIVRHGDGKTVAFDVQIGRTGHHASVQIELPSPKIREMLQRLLASLPTSS